MLVRVETGIAKDGDIPLQLLNLIEVVDESLGYLLDEKRSVSNVELNVGLDVIVGVFKLRHV